MQVLQIRRSEPRGWVERYLADGVERSTQVLRGEE
jgi:hypothetical protein